MLTATRLGTRLPRSSRAAVFVALAWLTPGLSAQSLLYTHEGQAAGGKFAFAADGVGDVDHDGHDDYVVGEPQVDGAAGAQAGRAVVYSGASGQPLVSVEGFVPGGFFGYSVAAVGDADGDGDLEWLVGAPHEGGGRAYVLRDDGSVLHAIDGPAGSLFGLYVAPAGDANGDGFDDVAISAPQAGRVYVHSGLDASLLRAYSGLIGTAPNGIRIEAKDAGDLDADGVHDLIVAEPFAVGYAGRVRVFSGASGALLQQWIGESSGSALFGWSTESLGDVDADGVADILVGISHKIHGNFTAGEVRVFSGSDGGLISVTRGANQSGTLGRAADHAGDINGDGTPDWIGGLPYYDDGDGEAWIVSGASNTVLHEFPGDPTDPGMPVFGYTVAGVGDVNADGYADLLVGSPGVDGDRGRAHVFAGRGLFLRSDRDEVPPGGSLTLSPVGGPPGARVAVVLTSIDGVPFARSVEVGRLDGLGDQAFDLTLPASLSGALLTFRALSRVPGRRLQSDDVVVRVQ